MSKPDAHERDDWVQVAELPQPWQADLLVGWLRENAIDAQIIDQTFHQEPLPGVRAFAVVRIFVPASQQEQARRLIAEGFELAADTDIGPDEDA